MLFPGSLQEMNALRTLRCFYSCLIVFISINSLDRACYWVLRPREERTLDVTIYTYDRRIKQKSTVGPRVNGQPLLSYGFHRSVTILSFSPTNKKRPKTKSTPCIIAGEPCPAVRPTVRQENGFPSCSCGHLRLKIQPARIELCERTVG